MKRTLILYASTHHGNTRRLAEVMAEAAGAELCDLLHDPLPDLSGYDLIGMASGIYYGKLHPRIPELLRQIQAAGKQNFLASSKPEVFCREILDHFSILEPFSQVAGSDLEGKRDEKHAVLQYLLEQSGIDPAKAVMIGDRKFDVLGAAEFSIPCIGVLWGYGSREELEKAGAAAAVSAPEELSRLLLGK